MFSCLWVNILIKESTEGRVVKNVLCSVAAERPVDVVQLREERIWQGGKERDHPNQCNDLRDHCCSKVKIHAPNLDGPRKACHGVLVKRMADGKVSLHGEGKDGEHRSVAGHLRDQGAGLASHLAQGPRVLLPVDSLSAESQIWKYLI